MDSRRRRLFGRNSKAADTASNQSTVSKAPPKRTATLAQSEASVTAAASPTKKDPVSRKNTIAPKRTPTIKNSTNDTEPGEKLEYKEPPKARPSFAGTSNNLESLTIN